MIPYTDYLFLRKEALNDTITTNSGIVIIDGKAKREKIDRGIVISVANNLKSIYKEGDVVVFPKYGIGDQNQEGFYMKHDSILGLIK